MVVLFVACGMILVGGYLVPSYIARTKLYSTEITTLNLLFGWTGIGWIAALVWALRSPAMRLLPQVVQKRVALKALRLKSLWAWRIFVVGGCIGLLMTPFFYFPVGQRIVKWYIAVWLFFLATFQLATWDSQCPRCGNRFFSNPRWALHGMEGLLFLVLPLYLSDCGHCKLHLDSGEL